ARVLERRVLDQARRRLSDALGRIHAGIAGRKLGPAAQARPEAGRLGRGRARIKTAVLALRRADSAHRPAADPGRAQGDEEAAVEGRVMRAQGAVTGMGIERHDGSMRRGRPLSSPFSDFILAGLSRSENGHRTGPVFGDDARVKTADYARLLLL